MADLESEQRRALIDVARLSILSVVHASAAPVPMPGMYAPPLRALRASFVTLQRDDELRGCCGTLEARHALVVDVWKSARAAACEDQRFAPVRADELDALTLQVSVLTPLERLEVLSERELIEQLRPELDGVCLRLGGCRATFLPKVWEDLGEATRFLRQLRIKAGLPERFWSSEIEWFRYQTETFGDRFATGEKRR